MARRQTTTEKLAEMRARAEANPATRQRRRRALEPVVEEEPDEADFEPAPRRRPSRQPSRDAHRETVEATPRGALVVTGRNGEQLARRRTQVGDVYHVPPEVIPEGWDYQWNPVTVTGKEVTEIQNVMYANGWRPVPADRHAGRWTRPGASGDIIVEGLRLEERPEALTEQALAEEEMKARRQIRDQSDILKMGSKMPRGFTIDRRASSRAGYAGGNISIQVDKSFDVAPAEYQPADDDAP